MLNGNAIKADAKMIVRDPIMLFFIMFPLFIFILSKLLIVYGGPMINEYTGFDLTIYYGYVLALAIIMTPSMLGTVTAFLMIDERDSRVHELIFVTPISRTGYLTNRLTLPFMGSIVYTLGGYFLFDIYEVSLLILLYVSVLTGAQGIIVSLVLYTLAADKVQGLTYSKALGIFTILAMADVIDIQWVSLLASFTPFYWITQLIMSYSIVVVLGSLAVHVLYTVYMVRKVKL